MKNFLILATLFLESTAVHATSVQNIYDVQAVQMCLKMVPANAAAACAGVKSTEDAVTVGYCAQRAPTGTAGACAGLKAYDYNAANAVVACLNKVPANAASVCKGSKNSDNTSMIVFCAGVVPKGSEAACGSD